MNNCKKNLQLLSIFAFLVPHILEGTEFKAVDFERLLNRHPLMRQFDPETGRFKGTPSEIIPVEVLQNRVASLTGQIAALEQTKSDLVASAMVNAGADESAVWLKIGEYDRDIDMLRKRLAGERELLDQKGVPAFSTLFAVASDLVKSICRAEMASNTVVINKLPRFPANPPVFGGNDLRHFFYSSDPDCLETYLSRAGLIGLMFAQTDDPIIFQRAGEQ